MTYSVTWSLTAIARLDRIAAASDDPDRIRWSAARIDFTLRRTPRDQGESRSGADRLWYEDVLGVYFRIDEVAMTVLVMQVALSRRRK